MYQRRIEMSVAPTHLDAFETWTEKFGQDRKKAKGFLGQTLLQSWSVPSKFTTMVRWESFEAADAYSRSPQMKAFLEGNSPEGVTMLSPIEAYQNVFDVKAIQYSDDMPSACETFTDISLQKGAASVEDFESTLMALASGQQAHADGFSSMRVRKSVGVSFRYLVIGIWDTLESAQFALTNPAVLARATGRRSLVDVVGTIPESDAYRVVHRIAP